MFPRGSSIPTSKNNRSFDTPVKGPPQGPRLHIDIPRVQLLIEDKEGIKQIGEKKGQESVAEGGVAVCQVTPADFCPTVVKMKRYSLQVKIKPQYL